MSTNPAMPLLVSGSNLKMRQKPCSPKSMNTGTCVCQRWKSRLRPYHSNAAIPDWGSMRPRKFRKLIGSNVLRVPSTTHNIGSWNASRARRSSGWIVERWNSMTRPDGVLTSAMWQDLSSASKTGTSCQSSGNRFFQARCQADSFSHHVSPHGDPRLCAQCHCTNSPHFACVSPRQTRHVPRPDGKADTRWPSTSANFTVQRRRQRRAAEGVAEGQEVHRPGAARPRP